MLVNPTEAALKMVEFCPEMVRFASDQLDDKQ
jgi:hypothetical protein